MEMLLIPLWVLNRRICWRGPRKPWKFIVLHLDHKSYWVDSLVHEANFLAKGGLNKVHTDVELPTWVVSHMMHTSVLRVPGYITRKPGLYTTQTIVVSYLWTSVPFECLKHFFFGHFPLHIFHVLFYTLHRSTCTDHTRQGYDLVARP